MRVFGKTEKGPVRMDNQDAFRVGNLGEHDCLAVVCDGMGGEKGGEVASNMAVDRIVEVIRGGYRADMSANSVRDMIQSGISSANALVYGKAQNEEALFGMGTTAVVCVVRPQMAYLVNVGDSRGYLLKQDGIEQITRDHTMVQSYVEQGKITKEEARNHPQKHLITRALGVEERVDGDYYEVPLEEGQTLLLCTDGLTGRLRSEDLYALFQSAPLESAADLLVDAAIREGGTDNITVVLITC